jgi:hypothetical protein
MGDSAESAHPAADGYLTELRERVRHWRALAQEAGARASAAAEPTERVTWERTAREYLDEANRVEELIAAINGKETADDAEHY